jgi:hypothetical protein
VTEREFATEIVDRITTAAGGSWHVEAFKGSSVLLGKSCVTSAGTRLDVAVSPFDRSADVPSGALVDLYIWESAQALWRRLRRDGSRVTAIGVARLARTLLAGDGRVLSVDWQWVDGYSGEQPVTPAMWQGS